MSRSATRPRLAGGALPVSVLLLTSLVAAAVLPVGIGRAHGETVPDHLVISELVTGGASASDELIELHNPTMAPLPLEGLELVYVTASGLTISRRAAWDLGAPSVPPGGHVLVANGAGLYAGIADAAYASGIAATGGSVALRVIGASSAIDALGWGAAASTWLEGTPAPAPAAGSSLERQPGGADGSAQDTDDNLTDFIQRAVPDPQNLASPPTPDPAHTPMPSASPSASPAPTDPSTPVPTVSPSASSDPSPGPSVVPIGVARAAPDGTAVTIEGVAVTGSTFGDGGGHVADSSAGIAVLLSSGSFERGARVRISGTVDDRFAQRTLRAAASDVVVLGPGTEPSPVDVATGSVGETVESRLVRVRGAVQGAPTQLSAGPAYEIDDGSGPIRVLVATTTAIDTAAWSRGTVVDIVGVVGQRDSSGTGTAGYRAQPRDPADVRSVVTPSPSPEPSAPDPSDPGASPSPGSEGVISVAEARALPRNARATVRGTVTLVPGVVDPGSAALQDSTGAILLRVADEVGPLSLGERIEVTGMRSTLQGMETLRVTSPPRRLAAGAAPAATLIRTGDAGEAHEARLVRVRGALATGARSSGSGSVWFDVDDGSGPLRVFLGGALGADTTGLDAGAWVEVTGVLGQETTGALPLRGYRVWPRSAGEVRISAPATGARESSGDAGGGLADERATAGAAGEEALADLGAPELGAVEVGATVVAGPWADLEIGGLLWDGERLAGLEAGSAPLVTGLLRNSGRPPIAVELRGLAARGTLAELSLPLLALGTDAGDVAPRAGAVDPPHTTLPRSGAAWVSLVGRLVGDDGAHRLMVDSGTPPLRVDRRCDDGEPLPRGLVQVTGIGLAEPRRLVVPCDGVQPAPRLVSSAPETHAAAPADAAAADASRGTASKPDATRLLAVGLLALGSLGLASGGALAWRLAHGPIGDPVPTDEGSGSDEADEAPVPATGPAQLTLVTVPRERGSP